MSDLVGNPEDRFSRVEAHMISTSELSILLVGKLNSLEHVNQHDMIIEKLKDRLKGYEEQLISISEMKDNVIELKQSQE